jgi:hypothetical protein
MNPILDPNQIQDYIDDHEEVFDIDDSDVYTDEEIEAIMKRHDLEAEEAESNVYSIFDHLDDEDADALDAMDFPTDPFYGQELNFND